MFPSSLPRRAAISSSLIAGTFAFALLGGPAQAAATPKVGGPCTALTPTSLLTPLGLKCVGNTLTSIIPALPSSAPTSPPISLPSLPALPLPTSSAPSASPSSSNPVSGLVNGVTGTVNGLTGGAAAPVTSAVNNAVNSLLSGSLPSTSPTTGAGGTAPGTGTGSTGSGGGTTTGATGTGTNGTGSTGGGTSLGTTSRKPSTKDGSSLLGPAAAFLPGSSLANFADLTASYGPLLPLADNIPSPLVASPEGKLAAVQAPLIAASERAANDTNDGLFNRFGGKALPGLLVVIATAMVAAVGAGNLRALQARLGTVNMVNLRAWKRSTRR